VQSELAFIIGAEVTDCYLPIKGIFQASEPSLAFGVAFPWLAQVIALWALGMRFLLF